MIPTHIRYLKFIKVLLVICSFSLCAQAQSWIQLSPSGSVPSVRGQHTGVYDGSANTMIVFGGYDGGSPPINEVWLLKGANGLTGTSSWLQLSPSGTLPTGRRAHGRRSIF
jgi:hypothetical protein